MYEPGLFLLWGGGAIVSIACDFYINIYCTKCNNPYLSLECVMYFVEVIQSNQFVSEALRHRVQHMSEQSITPSQRSLRILRPEAVAY